MAKQAHLAWAGIGLLIAASMGCLRTSSADTSEQPDQQFGEIFVPAPPGGEQKKNPDATCKTGCSLAKHSIPDFARGDYEKALRAYAQAQPEAASEALETLLFYAKDTREFIARHGTGNLPAAHVAVLTRELKRDHALVAIRMVDQAGEVRVAYGPQRVPIGDKQHLKPVDHDLQPLEFNGTVMRTGVNYLWSRY